MTTTEAAEVLGLPVSAVEALFDAGYLRSMTDGSEPAVAVSEVKSFQARNERDGDHDLVGALPDLDAPHTGADAILDALGDSVADMARRTGDVLATVFPEAAHWPVERRRRFEADTRARFEAILSVTRSGRLGDDGLFDELADAGGAAAFAGAPLPQVLLTLRISRDLMVQTAVAAAEERGRHWGLALAVVLTRILPVLDRLVDAVARGYWHAVVTREQEAFARYEHVVEHSASGVYEVDLDGFLTYANPAMAAICGRPVADLEDLPLVRSLPPAEPTEPDVYHSPTITGWRDLRVCRADGVERLVSLHVTERRDEGRPVGYDGVVRDVTAERELERLKNDFLALMTQELRRPLTAILGAGAALESRSHELAADDTAAIGRSVRRHAGRITRLADDLYDVSRLRVDQLTLQPARTSLRSAIDAAVDMLPEPPEIVVDVPAGVEVQADPRRLEQVLAHLIENAGRHGLPPVRISLGAENGWVECRVDDRGEGVPARIVSTVFARLHTTSGGDRLRDRPSGLGLPLARGLVEAMGGRLSYEHVTGRTRFVVRLPSPYAAQPDE